MGKNQLGNVINKETFNIFIILFPEINYIKERVSFARSKKFQGEKSPRVMSFKDKLKKKMHGEWQEAYVAYTLGKLHLKPFKVAEKLLSKLAEKGHAEDEELKQDMEELSEFEERFLTFLQSEREKFLSFLSFKLNQIVEEYELIRVNLALIQEKALPSQSTIGKKIGRAHV